MVILHGINRTELAVMNAIGSSAAPYFRNLDRILNQMPCNIMGLPWYQVKSLSLNLREHGAKVCITIDTNLLKFIVYLY